MACLESGRQQRRCPLHRQAARRGLWEERASAWTLRTVLVTCRRPQPRASSWSPRDASLCCDAAQGLGLMAPPFPLFLSWQRSLATSASLPGIRSELQATFFQSNFSSLADKLIYSGANATATRQPPRLRARRGPGIQSRCTGPAGGGREARDGVWEGREGGFAQFPLRW